MFFNLSQFDVNTVDQEWDPISGTPRRPRTGTVLMTQNWNSPVAQTGILKVVGILDHRKSKDDRTEEELTKKYRPSKTN